MKKIVSIVTPMLLSLSVYAADWGQSLSMGLNLSRGNTENTQFNLSYDAKRKRDHDQLSFKAAANFGEDDVQKNTDNYFVGAQYNRTITNRLFWLVNGSYEVDNIADLDYRIQLTPGLGYSLIKKDGHTWDLEAGLGYLSTKYDLASSEDNLAYRIAEKWDYKLSETSSLWHSAEITGPLDEGDEYILKAVIGVQSKIKGNLNLKSYVEDKYSNEPALGKKKNDVSINTVLVYSF